MTPRDSSSLEPGSPEGGSRSYWLCQVVSWGLYFVTTIAQLWNDAAMPHARAILEPLFAALWGIFITHQLRAFVRRRNWFELRALALVWRVLAASVVLGAGLVAPLHVIEHGIYGDAPRSPWLQTLGAVLRWSTVFFCWVSLYVAVGLLRQRQRGRAHEQQLLQALQSAELRALKSQLNPHFLFNALNSVRALIADEPALAQQTITQLARMLRYTLAAGEGEMVLFERELATVDDYLGIESLRLAERLVVDKQIDASALSAQIPVMLLQTLVENAVKHGVARLPGGGTLRIRAQMVDGALNLEIENPWPGRAGQSGQPAMERDASEREGSPGIGLANARERLRLLCGPAARLELDLSSPGRALARVAVPQRAQQP